MQNKQLNMVSSSYINMTTNNIKSYILENTVKERADCKEAIKSVLIESLLNNQSKEQLFEDLNKMTHDEFMCETREYINKMINEDQEVKNALSVFTLLGFDDLIIDILDSAANEVSDQLFEMAKTQQ